MISAARIASSRHLVRLFSSAASPPTIAVTGSTGYIGSFVVAEALSRGYTVHCPVRNSDKDSTKAAHLQALPNADTLLKIFPGGDLEKPGSFDQAFQSVDAVIHTAAEVVLGESESIITASVNGTQNVLDSVDANPTITRFVQTSSVASVQRYDVPLDYTFTEADWNTWSTVERGDAYGVAKTSAERLVHKHFDGDEKRTCVAVNPGVVIGPVFTKSHTKASAVFLRDAIFGNKVMNFPATFVDVRDVAKAHINALEKLPEFHGRRFILTNDTKCFAQGAIELGPVAERALPGYKFEPQPRYPEAIMSVLRPLSRLPIVGRSIMSEVQRVAQCTPVHFSNKAAREDLGIDFRELDVTVKEGIESIVDLGFAKLSKK